MAKGYEPPRSLRFESTQANTVNASTNVTINSTPNAVNSEILGAIKVRPI